MNEEERKSIIGIISGAYPSFFEKKNDLDNPKARMKLWNDRLSGWDYEKTLNNLNKHIDTSPYEPKISEVKPKIKEKYGTFHLIKDELEGIDKNE